ncbi:tyrosine-type recombinase/integrase [Nocardia salmonicida]|uniref:tyrosine-type recombinase/integrase n=1 Tax=Nocardia salmonicida TaxID=53431 RepID=UPI0007A4C591|nr:tyrosine-type recombinase/integrase [Nocardia salmonicida]
MPRQRMSPGEWGKITVKQTGPGQFTARTYVRDEDGERRQVERSGASEEAARRNLQGHLKKRTAPVADAVITDRTTLAELFPIWLATKTKLKRQSRELYQQSWDRHGRKQIGALRVRELPTSRAERHLSKLAARSESNAKTFRVVLVGMFALAVRYDVLPVNPIRETTRTGGKQSGARALTPDEFATVRKAVNAYRDREKGFGPRPGRNLPEFVDVLVSTGWRPNEVLSLRWCEVNLTADPPTVTTTGTMIDHGKVKGQPLHRQDTRKGDAPDHTVILPKLAVQALNSLRPKDPDPDGPVFANRNGEWMSLANMRRSLRAALPEDLKWVTPRSFRPTVATVVRDDLGPAQAQAQLSHAKLDTTERHYLERRTIGPDARKALDKFTQGK